MPKNTISNKESNATGTVNTTTATCIVARTRIGTTIFPTPDAQFAESTDTDL